jgi:hypothetical protein
MRHAVDVLYSMEQLVCPAKDIHFVPLMPPPIETMADSEEFIKIKELLPTT